MVYNWIKVGAISGALAVGLGAFGAHGLKNIIKDEKLLKNWETAAHYHLIHSLAIMFASQAKSRPNLVGYLFTAGIVIFSGSLYTLVLTQNRKWGAVTPIGGLSLIAGWLCLAFL